MTEIPPAIYQLSNLSELYLNQNRLACLPPDISQLIKLQILSLSFNELTCISSDVGLLTNLKMLYLTNNQISTIPYELHKLKNLKAFFLRGNLLATLPFELNEPNPGCLIGLDLKTKIQWRKDIRKRKIRRKLNTKIPLLALVEENIHLTMPTLV